MKLIVAVLLLLLAGCGISYNSCAVQSIDAAGNRVCHTQWDVGDYFYEDTLHTGAHGAD